MDGRAVSKAIRRDIWPLLREAGFSHFTARTGWRYTGSRIDVLNFQSLNSYHAGVVGCTTYSFSVNLGVFLCEVPPAHDTRLKIVDGRLLPAEHDCHLRGRLHRTFRQPEFDRRDIWYIDPDGQYLQEAMNDVRRLFGHDALPWYESLHDSRAVLRILVDQPEDMDRLWGFGRNPSPLRSYLTGYMALALRERDLARRSLGAVLQTDSFKSVHERIAKDLEAASGLA